MCARGNLRPIFHLFETGRYIVNYDLNDVVNALIAARIVTLMHGETFLVTLLHQIVLTFLHLAVKLVRKDVDLLLLSNLDE